MTRLLSMRLRVVAALLVSSSVLAGASISFAVVEPSSSSQGLLLPDLDPIAPKGLTTQVVAEGGVRRFRLGFVSAAENLGAGALIVRGHRSSEAEPQMIADQEIAFGSGSTVIRTGVGTFEYVEAETHEHWHLLRFMAYELRRERGFRLVVPDRKTGFCLGDRYDADPDSRLPGEPAGRVYNTSCGPRERGLLEILEGISVGWADVYEAWRDAQYLDVTGLPAGRYVLVHRVNPGRRLQESRYGNNASSVLVSLAWPRGLNERPRIRLLRSCPQTARCSLP